MYPLRLACTTLLIGWLLPNPAAAGFTDPLVITPAPEDQGEIFSPGFRLIADLEIEYVEEEYFAEGAATVYTYNDPPVRDVIIPLDEDVPYRTRFIVRRPANVSDFNGTVIIEWWNSTAGFDTAPVWDPSAEYFGRSGIVYVGITNSSDSIDHLTGGCSTLGILPPTCGTRYATLSIPANGVAYEMVSQLANALKNSAPESPLPDDFIVERLFHAGQSQQGGSMVTYATAFHFPANDGYFIQAAGTARPINFGPACSTDGSPPHYPDCTPRLEGDARLVRTDLPVPVYRAQTETDMLGVLAGNTRQEDSDTFRYYEMAGTAHTTVHIGVEVVPASLFPPNGLSLQDICVFPLNTIADGPIFGSYLYNAMWHNMELQTTKRGRGRHARWGRKWGRRWGSRWDRRWGRAPPHGELMETIETDTGTKVATDEFGNALGGIRLPDMDVPIALIRSHNAVSPAVPALLKPLLGLFCRLSGIGLPFTQEKLDELYPTRADYLIPYLHATNTLRKERFLLREDAAILMEAAIESEIGACGLGFEIVLVVAPLMWLRGRRKRAGC